MDPMQSPIYKDSSKNMKSTSLHVSKPTSLTTLIVWNISKALEKSPTLNIKEAVTSAQSRLDQISYAGDIQNILSDCPYEHHLSCALLAWQQLGHRDADSLCRFVENRTNKVTTSSSSKEPFDIESLSRTSKESKISKIVSREIISVSQDSRESRYEEARCFSSFNSLSMGPVIKLPVETQVVMRLDNAMRCGRSGGQSKQNTEKDITSKIDQACCMESACSERLAAMDATTTELRARACKLARREAERVELLERAETAWKDLELGYQRRLSVAEEKEEDIAKQISRMLEERVNYKNACTILAQELKDRSGRAEMERTRLSELEKQVCERACQRMRVSEESARGDALIAEQSCRAAQLDRDLQFKEEQVRRNMANLQGEVAAMRALAGEGERATRAELGALRDQLAEISSKLLDEDAQNDATKLELEELRHEKMEIIEDLDGCKALCEGHMQEKKDDLTKKREELAKLREKVMECKCKGPVDKAVEAKRTPSLAALCKCSPEDKILECCSCTSMRTQLLSNLFADLFGGLQAELSGAVTLMPCQLLKCLEDKHNWDRPSVVKSNLKSFFSKLLVGELDIAIATSIENYHVKWVGTSCADAIKKVTPGREDDTEQDGWQERAIERRAQKLASQLAEQLFQERAEELTQRARDVVDAGPPPCECDVKAKLPEGCSCGTKRPKSPAPSVETAVQGLRKAQVTQLRLEVENLKQFGSPPERDIYDAVERKPMKKAQGKVSKYGGHTKKNEETAKCVTAKESTVTESAGVACCCSVKRKLAAAAPTPPVSATASVTPVSWQQAIHDVTLLRFQIEDLKKETIKKEDLKIMENKIAKIIHRASGSTASTNPKLKYVTDGNFPYEVDKYKKGNKALNNTGLHFSDIDKNKKAKPILNRGINKPYKKSNPTYAVNMCLCSTKRQERRYTNESHKLESSTWKQKNLKDSVSILSSSIKQSKPINDSFLSEDVSPLSYSNDYEYEKSCPSNCVCFHKVPSNTSINKLLETLAKWKSDLDASFTEKYPEKISCCNLISKINCKCLDNNTTFESKTSLKSRLKSQDTSIQIKQDLVSNQDRHQKIEQSNTKVAEKVSTKSNGPATTDSVYMGAVNLDKSHEEICQCGFSGKNSKKTPFKCIASNKCSCEKALESRKIEGQIIHVKNEKHKEISVIRTRQERRVKDIVALPNTPKTKESQSLGKEITNNITNDNTDARVFRTSDYQIHFLGVTLVDVNPKTNNQSLLENDIIDHNNKNVMTNDFVHCEKYHPDNRQTNRKTQHDYLGKSNRPAPEQTDYTNRIDKNNRNILINNDDVCTSSIINNTMKRNETYVRKTYYENEDQNEKFSKDAMLQNYIEESDISEMHKNMKYKNNELGNKTAGNGKFNSEVKADAKNSHESDISKKSYITASENNQNESIATINYRKEVLSEKNMKKNQSSSSNQNINTVYNPQMLSCECSLQLDEFKKFINANFTKCIGNENVALDVQSLTHFKERDESCVCCSKLNNESCRDLEENTFNLLEEYLKKKLNEFRKSSCNSFCIPAEEEDKIFSIIVQRVKRLISDSTNQITCKCSTEKGKSQGSWNRAYGLLQEYLKIKIKKVQCSCLLAEDNKDTILPDVLEKISNLIEYDFHRLKNICSNQNSQENKDKSGKQVNFEAVVPEKDKSIMFHMNLWKSAFDDQIDLSAYQAFQSKPSTQSTLAMGDETYNPQETNDKNVKVNDSEHSLHKQVNCDSSITNIVKLCDKQFNNLEQCINEPLSNTSSKPTDITSTEMTNKHKQIDSLVSKCNVKTNKAKKPKPNKLINDLNKSKSQPSKFVKIPEFNKTKMKQNTLSSSCNKICHQKSADLINTHSSQNIKKTLPENQAKSYEVPYCGYTITCSCDEALGPCVCPKNITNTDPDMINDIWMKSLPNDKLFEKFSYILAAQPIENDDQNVNSQVMSDQADLSDIFNKKPVNDNLKSEATCCNDLEPLVLKRSTYDVVKSHAETNTFKDAASINTDCSNNEDVDWCECTSQFILSKQADSDRLKRSIYFPAPLEDFDEHPKNDITNEIISSRLCKHVCNCEMVPICHVKMLVENIETKLANANCTCDSLIPKVCPVHSKMC